MALRERWLPRTQQPQEAVRLDVSHPLVAALDHLWLPDSSTPLDRIHGLCSAHAESTITVVPTPAGLAISGSSAEPANVTLPATGLDYPHVVVAYGTLATNANWDLFRLSGDGSFLLITGSDTGAGQLKLRRNYGTTQTLVTSNTYPTNTPLCAIAVCNSAADYWLCLNGELVSGTTSFGSGGSFLTSVAPIGRAHPGHTYLAGYGRGHGALSAEDAREITRDPARLWQMFEPQRIWVPVSAGGGGATDILAGVGASAATGLSASIALRTAILGGVASAAATGESASIAFTTRVDAAMGSAAASGLAASISSATAITAGVGAAAASGVPASIQQQIAVAAGIGTAAASGSPAAVALTTVLAAGVGAAAASGVQASVSGAVAIACGVGAAAATGLPAAVTQPIGVAAGVGAAAASGLQAGITVGTVVSAGVGSASAAGLGATITVGNGLVVSGGVGAAVASGQAVALSASTIIVAGVAGADASGAAADVRPSTLVAGGVGAAAASGSAATIITGQVIAAGVGAAVAAGLGAQIVIGTTELFSAAPLVPRLQPGTRPSALQPAARPAAVQPRRR
ncbi:MAG: hypothetical protein KJ023_00055 [Burkholderiaceae bacterium]|nr:hypothetical protein [Burkholderiaceae bacterium]